MVVCAAHWSLGIIGNYSLSLVHFFFSSSFLCLLWIYSHFSCCCSCSVPHSRGVSDSWVLWWLFSDIEPVAPPVYHSSIQLLNRLVQTQTCFVMQRYLCETGRTKSLYEHECVSTIYCVSNELNYELCLGETICTCRAEAAYRSTSNWFSQTVKQFNPIRASAVWCMINCPLASVVWQTRSSIVSDQQLMQLMSFCSTYLYLSLPDPQRSPHPPNAVKTEEKLRQENSDFLLIIHFY